MSGKLHLDETAPQDNKAAMPDPSTPEPYGPLSAAAASVAVAVETATVEAATAAPAVKICRRLGLIELTDFLTGGNCEA